VNQGREMNLQISGKIFIFSEESILFELNGVEILIWLRTEKIQAKSDFVKTCTRKEDVVKSSYRRIIGWHEMGIGRFQIT